MDKLIDEINKYKGLFESLESLYIFIIDTKRRYVYLNKLFMMFLNTPAFPLYCTPEDLFPNTPKQMSKIKDEDEKIISGELNNSERIYNGINAAGERAHIKIFKTPLKSKDHIIGIIGIGIDITEEYITEEILIQKGIWTLAPLEKTYLFMMARGRTRKQIYRELNISEVQGDKIKSNLIRKLDLNGKPDEIPYLLRAYCKILRSIE